MKRSFLFSAVVLFILSYGITFSQSDKCKVIISQGKVMFSEDGKTDWFKIKTGMSINEEGTVQIDDSGYLVLIPYFRTIFGKRDKQKRHHFKICRVRFQ